MKYVPVAVLAVMVMLAVIRKNTAIEPLPVHVDAAPVQVVQPEPDEQPLQDDGEKEWASLSLTEKLAKNPNNCNLSVQVMWADGSCHDKPVAQAPKSPKSNTTARTGDCEAFRPLLAKYRWNVETMMYAMRKESGCNPGAVGDNYPIGGLHAVSCGLLQVRTLKGRPSCGELKDPETNVAWAYRIWQGQGYSAWSTLK